MSEVETKTETAAAGEQTRAPQDIVDGFRRLRDEQQQFSSKLGELDSDKNEHRLVIETLEKIGGDRKCFRLVGGVLIERTVAEVLPALRENHEQISMMVDRLQTRVAEKGKELNEYREKYNIRVMAEPLPDAAAKMRALDAAGPPPKQQ